MGLPQYGCRTWGSCFDRIATHQAALPKLIRRGGALTPPHLVRCSDLRNSELLRALCFGPHPERTLSGCQFQYAASNCGLRLTFGGVTVELEGVDWKSSFSRRAPGQIASTLRTLLCGVTAARHSHYCRFRHDGTRPRPRLLLHWAGVRPYLSWVQAAVHCDTLDYWLSDGHLLGSSSLRAVTQWGVGVTSRALSNFTKALWGCMTRLSLVMQSFFACTGTSLRLKLVQGPS